MKITHYFPSSGNKTPESNNFLDIFTKVPIKMESFSTKIGSVSKLQILTTDLNNSFKEILLSRR